MSGYGGSALAVKVEGTGDITKNRVFVPKSPQRVGSGVIVGEHVYIVEENAVPHCFDVKTGAELWKADRLPGGSTWGSMVHADGKLYVMMRNGVTHVMAAKPKFELLASNPLGQGEQTNSSIAIADGDLYLRTFKHLYRIGAK
jgi:outer membrane protein assembly factor BamB